MEQAAHYYPSRQVRRHAEGKAARQLARQGFRSDVAYDRFTTFLYKASGLNRAARRHPEKASTEVMVGGSLLYQALLSGAFPTPPTDDPIGLRAFPHVLDAVVKSLRKMGAK